MTVANRGNVSKKFACALNNRLDRVFETFNGLRDYLYEIDPQFDDERKARSAFESGNSMFAGMNDMELVRGKARDGKRTLNTPFIR